MVVSPSVVFGHAEFAIDGVLLLCEHEQHDDEHDQRTLRGHVEAERKAQDWNFDRVELIDEHVNDVTEEEPDPEMRKHQASCLPPVGVRVYLGVALSHGSNTLQ